MKQTLKALALLLCILLCLSACSETPPQESTLLNSQPSESGSTESTSAESMPAELYKAACESLNDSQNSLEILFSKKIQRTINGSTYNLNSTGTVEYRGLGTKDFQSSATEDFTVKNGPINNTEYYTDGFIYFCNDNYKYAMTEEDFISRYVPSILLNADLYQKVELDTTSGNQVFSFSDATAPEHWLKTSENAQLVSATGTATLDSQGLPTDFTYTTDYIDGVVQYHVEYTAKIQSVNTELDISANPSATEFNADAYKLTLLAYYRFLDDSKAISSSAQEYLLSNALGIVRTQQTNIDIYGTADDSDFMAKCDITVNLSDYTGASVTNTQTELFRDGKYTYSANGSTPSTASYDASSMYTGCKKLISTFLRHPNVFLQPSVTETDTFLRITFNCDTESWDSYIQEMLGVNLNDYSTSVSTQIHEGYICFNKETGLPTSMGIKLERTHTIEGVAYPLVFQYDQSLTLSSNSAYKAITGERAPSIIPEECITPLFYKVTGKNGQTMYLLGTIHVGDDRTQALPAEIIQIFTAADALAVEADIAAFESLIKTDEQLQNQLAESYYYTDGTDITQTIDSNLYELAKALLTISGANSSSADYMKPAVWENLINNFLLEQSYVLSSDEGVDNLLLSWAKTYRKTIYEIESAVDQVLMPTKFSPELQTLLLEQIVSTPLAQYRQEMLELYELWCKGDEKALIQAVKDDTSGLTPEEKQLYEEYTKAMSTDRNAHMVTVAKQYLESGKTVFYAVGLAHVLAEDGLVNGLKAAGYTVELVTYK